MIHVFYFDYLEMNIAKIGSLQYPEERILNNSLF